jgi:hypothetical protein
MPVALADDSIDRSADDRDFTDGRFAPPKTETFDIVLSFSLTGF